MSDKELLFGSGFGPLSDPNTYDTQASTIKFVNSLSVIVIFTFDLLYNLCRHNFK